MTGLEFCFRKLNVTKRSPGGAEPGAGEREKTLRGQQGSKINQQLFSWETMARGR